MMIKRDAAAFTTRSLCVVVQTSGGHSECECDRTAV